jgi:NADPH:quinone reductase
LEAEIRVIEHGTGGPPSCMTLGHAAVPVPQADEVLIQVAFAGVNRPDCLQRSGLYPPPPNASPYMGLEAAGTVVAVGNAVSQWRIGDQVCALTNGGAYAEFVCAAQGQVLPVPKGLSLLQAAALPENYFTVYTNVIDRGRLQPGETILVHGGSSGIGLTAIQMAKAFEAKVICTVGSAEKQAACIKAGADLALNYREQNFVAEVLAATSQRGADVVLDMVGGEYTDRNLKSLAPLGRLVQIAFLQGSKMQIDLAPVMLKRLTVTGSTLRPRTADEKAAIAQSLREHIWPILEKSAVLAANSEQAPMLPVIHRVFDLEAVVAAHELMESSQHIGKIMLKVA